MFIVKPTPEYVSEMWYGNKGQANAWESMGGARKIIGCPSRMCNEAVKGDMSLNKLRSCRERAKLKW